MQYESALPATAIAQPAVRGRWYALTILTLIYSCHFLDRSVVSIVAEALREEFTLSDSQLGLLTGLGFSLTFALAGIPIGLLIDRVNRRNLLTGVVFLWSAMTAVCGLAQGFVSLLCARMAVGAAEAGGSPTSLSLISDYFPPQERSTAVGLFFLSNAFGGIMCAIIGGYVTVHYGWRAAFFVAGVPGAILAVVALLTLREPPRGGSDGRAAGTSAPTAPPVMQALRTMFANRALVALFVAGALAVSAVTALGAWLPPFFMRVHGMDVKAASFVLAVAVGGFGALGSLFGGLLADRVGRRGPERRVLLAALIMLLSIPVVLGAMFVSSKALAVALTIATIGLGFSVIPIAFGSMLTVATPNTRGISSATMQVVTNLLGYGVGPFGVGVISDWYGGPDSLRYAIASVAVACGLLAAIAFHFARRHMRVAP